MDKYIKLLLIQLSQKYDKVIITHIQTYNKKYNKISNIFKLVIKNNNKNNIIDLYNKKELVQEMMKWLEEKN